MFIYVPKAYVEDEVIAMMARLNVNNMIYEMDVEPQWTLLYVLREKMGFTGTKCACEYGECGACTVLMDGKPILSCLTLALEAEGKRITTIEGLAEDGRLHPLQDAFVRYHGVACGYCSPAMILVAKALLDSNLNPTEEDVRKAISGVLCRCTGYVKITQAIMATAQTLRGGGK